MIDIVTIATDSGITINIEKFPVDSAAEMVLKIGEFKNCLLHWGVLHNPSAPWQTPSGRPG